MTLIGKVIILLGAFGSTFIGINTAKVGYDYYQKSTHESQSAVVSEWRLPIDEVHDGDTIITHVDVLPKPLNKMYIRIANIDTPELHGKCPDEIERSKKAKDRLKELANGVDSMTIKNYHWDKYGGRITADIYIKGVNVGELMIKENLAHPFTGKEKKQPWCDIK